MRALLITPFLLTACESPGDSGPQKIALLETHLISKNNITLTVLTFDRRTTFLTVADKDGGPNSSWQSAQAAAKAHDGVAAINGGFFNPQGKPLGLVIENGKRFGGLTQNSLGAGIFTDSPPSLISRSDFKKSKKKPNHLLQSGPTLIWKGSLTKGLKKSNSRPRSFLLWDGKNHLALGHAGPTSLKGLAEALNTQPIPNFNITHALNLDGGSSSDLWVSPKIKGGGIEQRSWLNKPVRNYLILSTLDD